MSDAQRLVEQAAEDPVVAAILLRVDSPGGTVAGVSDLAEAVYAARKVKPVSAYISDLGASAAYYIASQAQRLYADSDALVGSIGVYSVVRLVQVSRARHQSARGQSRCGQGQGRWAPR